MKAILPLFVLLSTAAAQEAESELYRYRFALGLGAGTFDFDQDNGPNDDTDAGMFRFQFEGVSKAGFGGGVRLESVASDDDLFEGTGANTEITNSTLFAHFTYRLESKHFWMPLRAGIFGNVLDADVIGANLDTEISTSGLYVEIAPEIGIVHRKNLTWSVYGELGFGWGVTEIDPELAGADNLDSETAFAGLEVGTRVAISMFEVGLALVARAQQMEESDPEGGVTFEGFDASFGGLMLTAGVRF